VEVSFSFVVDDVNGDVEKSSGFVWVGMCKFDAVVSFVDVVAEVKDVIGVIVVEDYDVIHVSECLERLVGKR